MSNLLTKLRSAKKLLKPTETHVLTSDGRQLIESATVDADGNRETQLVATGQLGFVCDTKPDMQLAEVESGLFVAGQDPAGDLAYLKAYGITHIVNCASFVECKYPSNFTYLELSLLDMPDEDIRQYFDRTYHFIDTCLTMGGKCLVHCNVGISRSTTIVIAYLMRRRGMLLNDAIIRVRKVRPNAQPNSGFMHQLIAYDTVLTEHRNQLDKARRERASKQKLDEDEL